MFGMAAIAVLMGVGFASCTKENPDGNNKTGEKRLTKMVSVGEWGNEIGYIFTYNNDGKLNKAQYKDEWWSSANGVVTETYTFEYAWNGDIINITGYNSVALKLENGLIKSSKDSRDLNTCTYTYLSDRVSKIEEEDVSVTETTWNGDKLTKSVTRLGGSTDEYKSKTIHSYEGICQKGYCPLIPIMIEDSSAEGLLYVAHPELIGTQTTQLPASYTSFYVHGSTSANNVTYEFDKDGYISKINISTHFANGEYDDYSETYVLTWE